MKHAFAWLMALVLLAPITHAGETQMTQEQSAVLAALETMTAAFEAGDLEGVMASYADQATVLFEPAVPVSDRARITEAFAGFAAIKPRFTYSGHEVIVVDDLATHIAPWQMKAQSPDGQMIEQSGLSVSVWRRGIDGTWKMVIDNPHGGRLLDQ